MVKSLERKPVHETRTIPAGNLIPLSSEMKIVHPDERAVATWIASGSFMAVWLRVFGVSGEAAANNGREPGSLCPVHPWTTPSQPLPRTP